MHIHNKAVTLALLPVMMFLWLLGWSLFWIGSQNKPQKPKPAAMINMPITISPGAEENIEVGA